MKNIAAVTEAGGIICQTKIIVVLSAILHRTLRQRLTYRIFSLFLALLVLFGSTAKEFIHQFAGHEDTVHCNNHQHYKGELSFETQHHHCSFLGDSLAPFCADAHIPRIEILPPSYQKPVAHVLSLLPAKERFFTSLRGPPVLA